MKQIVWLASYPKSGNTWTRIFLNNLLHGTDEAPELDALYGFSRIASERGLFDNFTLLPSADLTYDEIQDLRPRVYEMLAEKSADTLYIKIHDARIATPSGEPVVPAAVTKAAVYIVRNPLDVAVSYAHHSGTKVSRMAKFIGKTGAIQKADRRLDRQLRQELLDWKGHAASWLDADDIPVHCMRYEDMLANPLETFQAMVRFLGLDHRPEQIQRAIELSSFDRLQKLEAEHGFGEKPPKAERFFRKGKSGSWRDELTMEEATAIIESQKDMMQRLGYPTDLS